MGDWTGGECAVRNLGSQSLQDSLGHNSPYALLKTPSRNSDVDFSDVFGGPPKRSSAQEFSHSERDSFDSHSLDDNDNLGDEESTWVKFREKPVFGEALGVRRRYTTDDFFDDIFRGDQPSSSSQSPRVGSRRNPFASAPGSRVMSPSRSLPTPELFATPAKFSLPSRLTNTDFTASTSSNQNSFNPPLSRFNQTIPNPDVSNQVSPQSSAFLRQNSTDIKESTCDSQLGGIADQSHVHSDVKVSELPIYATDFHFSIYKWASKGVPLVISLRKKSSRSNQATRLDKVHEDVSSYGLEDVIETQNPAVVHEHSDPPKSLPKKTKFSVKPLSSFLKEEDKVNIEKGRVEEKENLSSAKKDSRHKVDKTATKKDGRKSEASSKVKDFVKIFNQDSPSKTSGPQLRQSESRRWKDTKTVEVDYEIRFSSARMSEETEATYVNWGEELEDENPLGSQPININDIGFVPDTTDAQTTSTAPNVDTQRDSAPNTNVDSPRDSAPKTNEVSDDNVLAKEEIKGCETKVSLWAKGKEGNIRALLSTLQMVLWPDSGWKPVPLVDIIEASAVKRAYQKALLRLHPDKLQQKGASLHHKLIAEKVFDILQEAWDQFNSLGSV